MTIMAHPTQDMDISSSFISSDYLLSNNSPIQLYEKEMVMEENKVDLEWLHDGPIDASTKNYENRRLSDDHSIDIEISENIFPWLNKFNKLMRSFAGRRSYHLLRRLISLYAQNILSSINTYCERNLCETKLKEHLNNTLIFFHLYWHDIKEHVNDSNVYLNEMSVLLGIYIDLELRTFKPSMDSTKIASKLLSALWVFLCNSERHIFRVLLKLKFTAKKYSKIYDLVLMRSFKNSKKNMESLTDTDYVRYLLVLKLWQRIKDNVEEKKEVNKLALTILGPYIPKMRDELLKIVPKPPIGHKNETIWLLQPNLFDLNSACYNFVLFEETMLAEFKDFHLTRNCNSNLKISQKLSRVAECLMNCELQESERNNYKNNCPLENETKCHRIAEEILPAKRKNQFRRHKNVGKLKAGEVILIDLTEEDESKANKKEKRKRGTRELEWLKAMKKKCKTPKKIGEIKCKNQVEIADAHSTGNSENFAEEILLEHLPISDNKVSESTESCTLLDQEKNQMHDHGFNKKSNVLNCMFQQKKCDTCASPLAETDIQCNRVLYLLKLLSTMGENMKEPRALLNLLREYTNEDVTSCQHLCRNAANESDKINARGKQEFSQPESSIGTVPIVLLSNECQSSVTDMQPIKQELPMNADCNMLSVDTYCQTESVCVPKDCHLRDFKSNNNLQATESTKQKVSRDSHECAGCCKKIGLKPFSYHSNIFNSIKNEEATQNAMDDTVGEKKSICDKNIMCMLSDLDKCMDVLSRIGEHIMTVHAEKQRFESLEKTDICDVSTTVSGSQVVESSHWSWIEKMNSLTNSEKLCKVIELCGKKDIFDGCNCTESHKCQSVTVSTSQAKEYRSHGNENFTNSEDRPLSFARGRVKSEFDSAVKKENDEGFQVLRDELEKAGPRENGALTSDQASETEYLLYDPKGSKELSRGARNFSEKDNATRTRSAEEFENVDILDSILNGDITLEDEQEIWEDTQSSLISPANYDNSSSVLNCITELFSQPEGEEKYMVSDTENSQTPLPEGSLAAAGLLNSLFDFDFDLTNMDSPSNDFIYSSTQTVNPRLIKKNFADESFSAKSCNLSELLDIEEKIFPGETSNLDAVLLQREKELCDNRDVSIDSSVNVVGFGLNCSREEVLEFPSLSKNVSSFPGQSTILVSSDTTSAEAKESFPKSSISSLTDSIVEKSYIFPKKDINNVQEFNDIPQDASTSCTLNQQQNDVQSSHKYACAELETSPLVMKQSLDSYDLLSSTDFTSYSIDTSLQCIEQKHEDALEQENVQRSSREEQEVEINAEGRSKRSLRCKKSMKAKGKKGKQLLPQNELSLKCSQITVINPFSYKNIRTTYQEPPQTSDMQKQSRNRSEREQQFLLDFHQEPVADKIYNEDSRVNSRYIMEDTVSEDSNASCLSETPTLPENKSRVKFSKTSTKTSSEIGKMKLVNNKDTFDASNNSLVQPGAKWSSKFIEEQVISTLDEDTPVKRRKVASRFSSNLKRNTVTCTVNQQKMQSKHFTSSKTGITCTSRRKNMTGE